MYADVVSLPVSTDYCPSKITFGQSSAGPLKSASNATHALYLSFEALIPLGDRYYFLTRLPETDDVEINKCVAKYILSHRKEADNS